MRQYCLDTNVLIEAWNKYYCPDLCPGYWEILDRLAENGAIFCTMEVKKEILKTDDLLAAWVKDRPHLFREVDDRVQLRLRDILSNDTYQRLVDSTKGRSSADPWVIAHAMSEGAIVVTKETPAGGNTRRVRIPDVCDALGVEWMNDFEFLSEVGIRFSARIER